MRFETDKQMQILAYMQNNTPLRWPPDPVTEAGKHLFEGADLNLGCTYCGLKAEHSSHDVEVLG